MHVPRLDPVEFRCVFLPAQDAVGVWWGATLVARWHPRALGGVILPTEAAYVETDKLVTLRRYCADVYAAAMNHLKARPASCITV